MSQFLLGYCKKKKISSISETKTESNFKEGLVVDCTVNKVSNLASGSGIYMIQVII